MKAKVFISVVAFFITLNLFSQEKERDWSLNGYVKNMQTLWVDTGGNWLTDNLIHNRLNFKWYPNDNITSVIEMRNRFMWGEFVKMIPQYDSILDIDNGAVDMTWTVNSGSSYILHSMIDRAYIDLSKEKFNLRIGRQRINWGINLVWNPNDVFNAFSYIDFDYEERPGTDAFRFQYYPNYTSIVEFVYRPDEDFDKSAIAARYKFNKWSYDWQLIGGLVKTDLTAGFGWAGDIKGAGFRGEGTYFHPKDNISDTSGLFVASVSADYTFKNSLYIHAGVLYNSEGKTGKAGGMNLLMNSELSAKMLSLARYSTFGQVTFPITPILNGGVSTIFNPSDKSAFIGPSFTYSLHDNLDAMLMAQAFTGDNGTEYGDIGTLVYLRLKYSF